MEYGIAEIPCKDAKEYIRLNHYSHGCHNGMSPTYGLFDGNKLIGVLGFATPCSENVRASIFGKQYKDNVIELHRLHIKDCTPKNTESWFISRCLKLLKQKRPEKQCVVSFADSTINHTGIIYRATNAMFYGMSAKATFYIDKDNRLHHPRQSGINITKDMAKKRNWLPVKRQAKYRYLWLIGNKREKRIFKKLLKVNIQSYPKKGI